MPIGKSAPGKIDLTKSKCTFGTGSTCDCRIKDDPKNPNPWFKDYSWYQFSIEKQGTVSEQFYYICDLSDNGTYVNGKKIGKDKKRPLDPNAEISLVSVDNKAFVFIVESPEDSADVPEIIKSNYIVSKAIGKGAFGKVRQLFSRDGSEKVAMKYMKKLSPHEYSEIEQTREIQIMQSLSHPCITKIIETVDTPEFLYIIMELAEGGTLRHRLERGEILSESTTRIIIHQVLLAVEYLHSEGITHRDLKPDNILMVSSDEESLIKLTDFGVSKAVDDATMMATFAGTPVFLAPEMWAKRLGHVSSYTNAVDVWSIGIIMYLCITGELPILIPTHFEYIRNKPNDFIIENKFSCSWNFRDKPQATDLGLKLLKVEAKQRISVKDALKHDWFQNAQSRKRVEELTGLSLKDSRKVATNFDAYDRKRSLTKEKANEENLPNKKIHPVSSSIHPASSSIHPVSSSIHPVSSSSFDPNPSKREPPSVSGSSRRNVKPRKKLHQRERQNQDQQYHPPDVRHQPTKPLRKLDVTDGDVQRQDQEQYQLVEEQQENIKKAKREGKKGKSCCQCSIS